MDSLDDRPTIISLYSGAGGLDYGFEAAGFRTSAALDFDADSCETLRRNRSWPVIKADISDVPSAEILDIAGARPGQIDVLIGGPPCQPFSKSGYWAFGDARRLDDPRADTLGAYLRVLRESLPRVFLLENVEGLAYSGKSEGLDLILRRIEEINRQTGSAYTPSYKVLNAADFGVPQIRRRFFMVAAREGLPFHFPEPTHQPLERMTVLPGQRQLQSYRTAWDALADVAPDGCEDLRVRGKWADLLRTIPEGHNYLWHTDRGGGVPIFGWRRRYWSFLLKLAKNRPSWTLQAQPGPAVGPFHWSNRRLSARELCRLQTFPDDVHLVGSRTSIQRQMGNAVPSLLAEVLAREVRAQLLGLAPGEPKPHLLPPDRSPAPPPELAEAVSGPWLTRVGNHAPHPGTGLGERARRRAGGVGVSALQPPLFEVVPASGR